MMAKLKSIVLQEKNQRLRFWIMIGVLLLAVLGFEEVADDVFSDPLEGDFEFKNLDKSISNLAFGYRTQHLNQAMTDLTALGSVSVIVTLFIVFLSVLWMYRDFKGMGFISTVLLGAGLWPTVLKLFFERPRPEHTDWIIHVTNFSFPSGHSFGAAATYIGFAYYASLYARTWTHEILLFTLGATLALLVGVSRIYLGVHFPTDVLAGLAGGAAWGLAAAAVYEFFRQHNKPQDMMKKESNKETTVA